MDSPPLLRRVSVSLAAIDPREASPPSDGSGSDYDGSYWQNNWRAEDPERPIRHILRFFGWLERRAAPHVEQLSISLGQLVIDDEYEQEEYVTSELRCALHTCTRLRVGGGWRGLQADKGRCAAVPTSATRPRTGPQKSTQSCMLTRPSLPHKHPFHPLSHCRRT